MKLIKINYLLISAFILCLFIISISIYFAVAESRNELQKGLGENSILIARSTVNSVDRLIDRRIDRWQSYIYIPEKRPLLEGTLYDTLSRSNSQLGSMSDAGEYISKKDSEWKSAGEAEITPFMEDLINNSLSDDLRRVTQFYEEKFSYPLFPEVFITNNYGVNVAQTGKTGDYYQGDEEWWQIANKTGYYVSDFTYDESSKTNSIEIALRIEDSKKNPLGILLVVYNIKDIINLIKSIEMESESNYASTELKILSRDKRVVYSTDKNGPILNISENIKKIFDLNESSGYFIGEENLSGKASKTLYAFYASEGSADFEGIGEILVIKYATKDIFRSITLFQNELLLIFIVILIISLFLFIYISKIISNPLKRLDEDIQEITKGKLEITLKKSIIKEIQSLTDSLERVLISLKLAIFRTGATKEDLGLGEAIVAKEQAERNYKTLFDNAVDAIFIADPATRKLVNCNKAAERLTGYSREEILSMKADDLHPKDIVKETMDKFRQQAAGKIKMIYTEILTRDKQRIPVEINASSVDIEGRKYAQGLFRDISKEKEIEKKYRMLYESSRDAIMTIEPPDWKFTAGNPTCLRMFRVKNEKEFTSLGPWELSPERQPDGQLSSEKAKKMIMKAVKEGSNFFEWTHRRYKGENFPATVLLSRFDISGKIYVQATVRER